MKIVNRENSSDLIPEHQNAELNKLRLVFEQTPGAIFILDKDFKFEYVNPSFTKLSGYSKDELLGKTVAELFYHKDLPESRNDIIKSLLNGEKWQGELLTFNKSGSTYWANTIAAPYKDETGNVDGYVIIQQDITEKRQMKVSLEESEKFYRTLIESSMDAVSLNQNGKFLLVNSAFCTMFGYTNEEIFSMVPESFIAPEDRERVMDLHYKRMRGGIDKQHYTVSFLHKLGKKVLTDLNATTVQVNGQNASFITMSDITERNEMEKALRESEEKYRTVIEKATDGIVITQDGKLKFMNKTMCDMVQYNEEEILEKSFLEMVVEEDHQIMIDFHKRRMAGEDFTSLYRSRFIRKDGKIITVELNARTSNYNGNPAAFIIIRNISDRIKIENELQTAKNKLELLNAILEQRVKESSESLTEARTQLIFLQKENLQSQFDVLKQQVNPHFLFNSLNILTSLIKLEPNLAEKFSEQLSKVYRYVLENKDNELVDLNTELNFLNAYIFLLNIRFVDKLRVNINIPEAKRSNQIIPLAMQLLIENAIKHNIMSKSEPLTIDVFIDSENFLNIINNLQERPSQLVSTGVGLKNIQNRYKLLNNTEPIFKKTNTHFIAKVPLVIFD